MKNIIVLLAVIASPIILLPSGLQGQSPNSQTLKGSIVDKAIKVELVGATIQVLTNEANPTAITGGMSDAEGRFRISAVPLGRYTLLVRYLGYKDAVIPNVLLTAGKETDIVIEMEEAVLQGKEVVITAKTDKQKPLNELSTVSSRTFSVEETQRFAAAVNDPARMASSYAGVIMANDGNNHIVIRGNAPNGLLWRMEGVDIPNPNHFSNVGTAGGGISILSAQLLSNSDFSTGAFAAEYGNALSGVFDLKLRKGNADKREYTFQAGVLGIDLATEGPMRVGKNTGSYLVNYRYSTLSLLGLMGVPLGDARTDFQDLSFNVWIPAGRTGVFTLFGMGGLSKQTVPGDRDTTLWDEDLGKKYPNIFSSNTGAIGLTHSKIWGNTYLKTVISASEAQNDYKQDEYFTPEIKLQRIFEQDFVQRKVTISSVLSRKINARQFVRTGMYVNFLGFSFDQNAWDTDELRLEKQIRSKGNTQTLNAFAQWQYRPTQKLTLNAGVHSLTFLLNKDVSVEPRAGIKYQLSPRQTLSAGYGLHAQMQPLATYFTQNENGQLLNPELGLSKAHHFVLAFEQSLGQNLRAKTELYYQHLFQIPVERGKSSSFSMLNNFDGIVYETMENSGLGRNYGLELTLEKFLSKGLYYVLSSSVFASEYKGSDGIWRDSRFNTRYVNTFTGGKEWGWSRKSKDRTVGFNIKMTQIGGYRITPIDLEASRAKGDAVFMDDQAFSKKMPDYFRTDVGFRIRRNYHRVTTTFSLDIQNVSNRKNIAGEYYDKEKGDIKTFTQAPLLPILAYKIEF